MLNYSFGGIIIPETCDVSKKDGNDTCCDACAQLHDHTHEHSFEWKKKLVPFWISLIFALAGFIVEHYYLKSLTMYLMMYLFFGISYIFASFEVFLEVLHNLRNKRIFDENFLMFIATVGAIITQNYLEAIAVMLFYRVGETVEAYGVSRSQKSIRALLETRPDIASVKINGRIEKQKPQDVCIGSIILVKPGEKVPLDGKLLTEFSLFDTSALTGESVPRRIKQGEQVLAGMINSLNLVEIEVTKRFENSTIAKILDLVQNAESQKSHTEKFISKFAKYYTPVVVFGALILAIIPPLVISGANFMDWFYRALIFLVISCPCALVLSIPLTYFGGIGGASRNGVLIKGSNHLDSLSRLKTIVFDKTGTITKGNFKVTEIITVDNAKFPPEKLLESVAHAESASTHPIAKSIIEKWGKKPDMNSVTSFTEIPAHGVQANVNGQEVIAGSDKILHKFAVPHQYHFCDLDGTIVHVAIDRKYIGYMVIADEIKEDSACAIKKMRELGIGEMVMLSGDDACIVESLGEQLGFNTMHSNLLPEDKVKHVDEIRNAHKLVAFVGDGINDAPVIAKADIGIAMGALGSDAAIETADVVLMTDSLSRVATAIQIARKTQTIVWQNIIAIFIVKVVFLILGALGLMSMWGAVFADVGLAILAIINARRILTYNPDKVSP